MGAITPVRAKDFSGGSGFLSFDETEPLDDTHLIVMFVCTESSTARALGDWEHTMNVGTGYPRIALGAWQGDGVTNSFQCQTGSVGGKTLMAFKGFVSTTPIAYGAVDPNLSGQTSLPVAVPTDAPGSGIAVVGFGLDNNPGAWGGWAGDVFTPPFTPVTARPGTAAIADYEHDVGTLDASVSWSFGRQPGYMWAVWELAAADRWGQIWPRGDVGESVEGQLWPRGSGFGG